MVRLAISVEGSTEERFVKKSLTPYFAERDIYVTPVSVDGNVSVDRVSHELKRLLHNFDVVTTLYDFYGFKKLAEGENKASLEDRILNSVPVELRHKLIPYIQMYEFEGLLFSSPQIMARILNEDVEQWAKGILASCDDNPELINNSPETAPSKRLAITSYRKTTHGPDIAEAIGLVAIREKCKGFDSWIEQLENCK